VSLSARLAGTRLSPFDSSCLDREVTHILTTCHRRSAVNWHLLYRIGLKEKPRQEVLELKTLSRVELQSLNNHIL